MNRIASITLLAGLFAALAPGSADAGVIINVYQSGSNVVMSGSGTLDTTDLSFYNNQSQAGDIASGSGRLIMGAAAGTSVDLYSGISGPSTFGNGSDNTPSSGSGNVFGVIYYGGYLITPHSYTSGASLSATDTYSGYSLSNLGLTAGQTYTYTWGSGGHTDSLVIDTFAPTAVPEPSSLAMCGLAGLIGAAYAWRRRKRAA
jgi:hypothetical protein